ncbi:MAG: glycosyltransferase family 4 protein [Chloroflexota bacterium]
MRSPDHSPWIVLCETERRRWGGDLRRAAIFHELALATGALEVQGWGHEAVRGAIRRVAGPPVPWRRRPAVASSEFLSKGAVVQVRRWGRAAILDVHDHPIAQAEALGHELTPDDRSALLDRLERNLGLFPLYAAPSATFADLAGLDPGRTIVAPNGTDTTRVTPGPPPRIPAVGMVSGAAPGRGIESLIEAVRRLRSTMPDLRLLLWLAGGDEVGQSYLDQLLASHVNEPWIEFGSVQYGALSDALRRATVLVVPHPANAYMDVAVPVKLLDSMAAGRPVVVTPRTEMRRIVETAGGGIIAAGDSAGAIAAAILPILEDPALASRLGANARAAAERDYDWAVIGRRLASEVIDRFRGAQQVRANA